MFLNVQNISKPDNNDKCDGHNHGIMVMTMVTIMVIVLVMVKVIDGDG